MYDPVSTYRLQFHRDFTFSDLERLIPYFEKLGIRTIYASPVFKAVPGSMHGYDTVNPQQINPEIGTTSELKELVKKLHACGIGWLQDIVPNHMAYHYQNPWLNDVLRKGKSSPFALFFDIEWDAASGKLLAPFLGADLEATLHKHELKIIYEDQEFYLDYKDNRFPLRESTVEALRQLDPDPLRAAGLANENAALVKQLALDQEYLLCAAQEAAHQINYRRFFTVNSLICLNIQLPQVFEEVHKLPLSLLRSGTIDGLRVDHIDGLYDPTAYLEQLRQQSGPETYLAVEKILAKEEALPPWPVQGCTGYEFLADVNNLLTCQKNAESFLSFYQEFTGGKHSFEEQFYAKKRQFVLRYMNSELDQLLRLFLQIDPALGKAAEAEPLRLSIAEFLVCSPVYRLYPEQFPLNKQEAATVSGMLKIARQNKEALKEALHVLELVLLQYPSEQNKAYNEKALHFIRRCMQFSGPLMAKGVEDTLFYTSNRFIGHNEVGDAPENFGISIETFHVRMSLRKQQHPLALNATSTHDTKRGEDARARLNVLSCMPQKWFATVKSWHALNAPLRTGNVPDANEEYFIYQTLVATFPFELEDQDAYLERFLEYLSKALREAKVHSSWEEPDKDYENKVKKFAESLFKKDAPFLGHFLSFQRTVAEAGCIHALVQLILKFTCPGTPDLYQGSELWDLSLVDPDNRRPVDYELRKRFLHLYEEQPVKEKLFKEAWKQKEDGRIKLFLTRRLLELRQKYPKLFTEGCYLPLKTGGRQRDTIIAFARRYEHTWIVVVLPLYLSAIPGDVKQLFQDTYVKLPSEIPGRWQCLINGRSGIASEGWIFAKELFEELPFAVLEFSYAKNPRSAGVLMPLSALPSAYGTGTMGAAAEHFLFFLSRSLQKYWQVLPLNPVSTGGAYSPYSSVSAYAIDLIYIDLEELEKEGWISATALASAEIKETGKAHYEEAGAKKQALLRTAFETFSKNTNSSFAVEFRNFCEEQSHWLRDFALFLQLRKLEANAPWYQWRQAYKERQPEALHQLEKEQEWELRFIKWQQFILHRQWQKLRRRAKHLGIKLLGDLPFYPAYDSTDVWANQAFFSLHEKGELAAIAGVPPDYFSKTGQLWSTPTFNWEELRRQNYSWWVARFRHNIQLFDLVRIDHFRALAEYWEVPAGEKNAVRGKWRKGPGEDFFEVMKRELGELPFVAEDLGYQMEKPYALREAVGLPGMKVLQYAFGKNFSTSVDIPHNYSTSCIVYTGTHDNNTTRGWFKQEASPLMRKHLRDYSGIKALEENCSDLLIRMAYASVAQVAVIPMQDLLNKNEKSRFNKPGTKRNNWRWRMKKEEFSEALELYLRKLVRFYNRI